MKKSPLLSSLVVIDGTSEMALSNSKSNQVFREHEEAIFVGSMTKIGKMSRKKPINKLISFFINSLIEKGIGIKLANEHKRHNAFCVF